MSAHAIWHDLECGSYVADLPLWRELARDAAGPVLDVGAGTGRVTLELARAGHHVTALDRDPELLGVLAERAAGLPVATLVADAVAFDAGAAAFALVAVPMQTIQLLPDRRARAGFFASARRALAPGGLVALAITDALESFDDTEMPLPDTGAAGGWRYVSQPTAVRRVSGGMQIERLRHTIAPGGDRTTVEDVVVLAAVGAAELEREGAAAGLRALPGRYVDATDDHVGSRVVLLRG